MKFRKLSPLLWLWKTVAFLLNKCMNPQLMFLKFKTELYVSSIFFDVRS